MLNDHPYGEGIVSIHEEGIGLVPPKPRDIGWLESFKVGTEVGVILDTTVVHHVQVYPIQLALVYMSAHNLHTLAEIPGSIPTTADPVPLLTPSLQIIHNDLAIL